MRVMRPLELCGFQTKSRVLDRFWTLDCCWVVNQTLVDVPLVSMLSS